MFVWDWMGVENRFRFPIAPVRLGVHMPAIDSPATGPNSAQIIDIQASRLERRAFIAPRPDLLTEREARAAAALSEHFRKRAVAMKHLRPVAMARRPTTPFVLPLPKGRASVVSRILGGAL